ncbi:DUF4843 domain-containing protein [Carboxylicivirga sediminis]|uniref:DUF4843 domain-containing protein n=1 Tax=Carboxylicivirga sediminis TaxID=2006564 RepID=A0A941F108_9BACT|nr:DUF4843 domain-containing protein [Carboxylicivirga sediminis]MBR8534278.1 DUF4843 domain-containing protein [Carboxylicivirga sediminis]
MKLINIILIALTLAMCLSCEKNERMLYDENYNALNFIMPGIEGKEADSLYINFMFYPDEKVIDTLRVQVRLLGMPNSATRYYKVAPVESGTTATLGEHYELKEKYELPADTTRTWLEVYINRDESLQDSTYRIQLQFESTDDFVEGLDEFKSFIVNITDNLDTPPPFWEANYLHYKAGAYHSLKCKKFIEIAKVDSPNWYPEQTAALDEYVKETRIWFNENPTYDEDGNRLYFQY